VSNETVTANIVLGRAGRRRKRHERVLSRALAEKMAALDIHEQCALRDGLAIFIPVQGCIRIEYHCRSSHPHHTADLFRRVDRRITRRYCRAHVFSWHPHGEAWERDLPRIVALSDELWIALEVAWHQIATYAERLRRAQAL